MQEEPDFVALEEWSKMPMQRQMSTHRPIYKLFATASRAYNALGPEYAKCRSV